MGKIMRVNANAAEAYVEFNLPADEDEVRIFFRLGLPKKTLNYYKNGVGNNSGYLADMILTDPVIESGSVEPDWDLLDWDGTGVFDGGYRHQITTHNLGTWTAGVAPNGGLIRNGFEWQPSYNTAPWHTGVVEPDWSSGTSLGDTIVDNQVTWYAVAIAQTWTSNTVFDLPASIIPTTGETADLIRATPATALNWPPQVSIADWLDGHAYWNGTFGNGLATRPAIGWQDCELHYKNKDEISFSVNGVEQYSFVPQDIGQVTAVRLGQISAGILSKIFYFKDVKITRDDPDDVIFEDDFSSGDLGLWDSYTGDVTVVDDFFLPDYVDLVIPPLVWDRPAERMFQAGIDRGVLYLQDGRVVCWNGLTSVEDTPNSEVRSSYLGGVKYLQYKSPGDFSAKLKAYTYPPEFDEINGVAPVAPGLHLHDQRSKSFGLSYRTRIGNAVDADLGYTIHILYNLLANPDSSEFTTLAEANAPVEFGWDLSGVPTTMEDVAGRPTSHISVRSDEVSSEDLQSIEAILYGTSESSPRLPTIDEIYAILAPEE